MLKGALILWLSSVGLLISAIPTVAALQADESSAVWNSESFLKTVRAIESKDWAEADTRDVAIAGLFEMGRRADRLEQQLRSGVNRLADFAYKGAIVLGVYLLLQTVLSLMLVIRVGRMGSRGGGRGASAARSDF